jgi:hypothetical protein
MWAKVAVLSAAFAFVGVASAAEKPPAQPTEAAQPGKPAEATITVPPPAAKPPKVMCHYEQAPGQRIRKKVCREVNQEGIKDRDAKRIVDDLDRQLPPPPLPSG